jgi:hypothetical protein
MDKCLDVDKIISVMEKRIIKYSKFQGHDLNIVGTRTAHLGANTLNDWITLFYIFERCGTSCISSRYRSGTYYLRIL